ncbi:MAG TPA: DMT family transporter [Anaerolineae bacterium]|nr:DMT family transporter [Anaerolineae bacterium]
MESNPRPAIHPLLGILVAFFAASTSSIFIRFAQALAPSLVIAAFRLSIATLILLPFTLTKQRAALRHLNRRQIWLAMLSGFFLAIHFATWITSLEYTTVASSVVLVSMMPLFVALLAPWILGESLTPTIGIGLGLALIGSVIVGLSDACTWQAGLQCPPFADFVRGSAIKGDLLALMGALAGAGYILIGKKLRPHIPLLVYLNLTYGTAAIVLIGIMFGAGQSPLGYAPEAYFWFLMLALLPQLVAHSTYNWALRYLSAAYVSITVLGEPIGSTILAFLLLGEQPTALMLVGGVLILAGIVVASSRSLRGNSA